MKLAEPDIHVEQDADLKGWQRVLGQFFSELHEHDYSWLLSSRLHSHLLTIKRTGMIVSRVRLIALLFAILTPFWSVIDYLFFPTSQWVAMFLLRISTGFAFFALFLFYKPQHRLINAYRALFLLFLIPSVFYIASQYLLAHSNLTGFFGNLIVSGYNFLPFILIICLAIFPLSIKENLSLGVLIIGAQILTFLFSHHTTDLSGDVVNLWLIMLLAGSSVLAGVSQLALMIVLVRQAIRDATTGCFTRRSGEELITLQFSSATRSRTALALAFIDLDHFKSVNDQFGHEAGDAVLQHATAAIAHELRSSDFLVRWGGEEFLVIMPYTSLEQAQTAMTRLRHSGLGKRPDGKIVTASIGIAEVWRDAVPDKDNLINLADHRMYLAKESGRNCIVCDGGENHSPEITPAETPADEIKT